ncbi:MAG: PTS sugar transporter subunit IIA [Armatimonadota bacterium]|nr:PTS sugar transporter subunit IIA [Armatimonadota bacterium]MDR7560636.1 PTS sugar transporter subunit IIA [Armatimonadota bacterium]MDR7587805.1 PTS sugar transporter subunit IIA [Armatimonadota bacterium]MDR7612666.1 PTS sugar transporter subunit IIA [Armatimonadota bacterium]
MTALEHVPVRVVVGIQAASAADALRQLGDVLVGAGDVDPEYVVDVLRREATFPTGLPTDPPVALPHADPNHVRRSAVAVGVCRSPVTFREMGNPMRELDVRVIFLLAIREKTEVTAVLRDLVTAMRDHDRLIRLQEAATPAQARRVLAEMLRATTVNTGG